MKYPRKQRIDIKASEGEKERLTLLAEYYGVTATSLIISSIDDEFKRVAKEAGFKEKVKTPENKRLLGDMH